MKTKGKHELITRIVRQSLVLAALLAMVLSAVGISRAQSSATSPETPAAKTVAAPAKIPDVLAAKPPARGRHEGITVHGHWVIEVKNPDGKVASHSEFENALSSGFVFAFAGSGPMPSGSSLLSALITAQTMVTPVAWAILLEGPSYPAATGAPCTFGPIAACLLLQNSPSSILASAASFCPSTGGDSCNLTVTPLGTAPNFTGFQLTASVAATQTGTISAVATMDTNACGAGGVLASCAFLASSGLVAFTSANLDGNTVPGDPLPVPVSTGQSIAVTVTISFQ